MSASSGRRRTVHRILAGLMLPPVAVVTVAAFAIAPASASRRGEAFEYATDKIGCPYVYGGTGPCHNGYDCSGLVWAAYNHFGLHLPRTSQEMLASNMIKPVVGHPHRGELVFFGSGHVALYYTRHVVLQAPEPGENVQFTRWYPGSGWVPTGYYKVKDAG